MTGGRSSTARMCSNVETDTAPAFGNGTAQDSATIVRSTIELAHNLDLSVIAEGVEDQRTFDELAALGCDMAQGYCISQPIPVEQFRAWRAPTLAH